MRVNNPDYAPFAIPCDRILAFAVSRKERKSLDTICAADQDQQRACRSGPMAKQIAHSSKGHLTRATCYLLLLFAGCGIPFALAQRGGSKQSVAKSTLAQKSAPVNAQAQFPANAGSRESVLWYNGDFNGVNGLANEENTLIGSGQFASVYDDFNVTDANGWDVTVMFSDNIPTFDMHVTGATWEIRQGISEGNGGTLVASGMTVTPIVMPTGRGTFNFDEVMIEVRGLGVHLPASANPYWLNVTPIGDGDGRSFNSQSSGANCVGRPCGNNKNAFFNSNFFGANWASTSEEGEPNDFSMGVIGSVTGGTPTPTPTATPFGNALWYNGDFNQLDALPNEANDDLGPGEFASVYDDFNVTDPGGWDVTSVFSHDLENMIVTGATWEIRQGISEGNGGTVIASGMTMTPVVTVTTNCYFGFCEFMIEVRGLSVHLPASANPYWLNVTPVGKAIGDRFHVADDADSRGRSFDSNTNGANCVGTPCGNNQNAFFNSNYFGANWQSTSERGEPTDFSMGVLGTVSGGSPSPTPTATATATATATVTATPTATATPTTTPRPTPTPRPNVTPRPRPTPPPRPTPAPRP